MGAELMVGLLSLAGTAIGTLGGLLINNKLVTFRLDKLEKKVDEHNHVIRRMYVAEEQIKVANHRIDDIEHEIKKG